ncbi:MAG TPA: hypothetical protein VEC57_11745 [Candidatus Limnocylindrales bacterium]|nr:hypothetical protein [Candidatus Limnocylindrales bacterium]
MAPRSAAIALAVLMSASSSMAVTEPDELMPGKVAVVEPATIAKFVAKPVRPARFELPDPSNDPVTNGATLRFFDTALRPDGDFTFTLPAGAGWKRIGSPGDVNGYRYKGAGEPGDPCKLVLVTAKVVKAFCRGGDVGFALPFQGNLGVILSVGTGPKRYCAEFGGTAKGDQTEIFKRRAAPAPDACPSNEAPTTTTTVTGAPSTTVIEPPTTTVAETPTTTLPSTSTTTPPAYYTVSVTSSLPGTYPPTQPGGGSISSTPTGIDGCSAGSTCSAQFVESSNVVLTATADSTSAFSGWANCPSPSGNTCTIANLGGPVNVTASFARVYRTLTAVAAAGSGQGTVTSSSIPGTTPINCGYANSTASACSEAYVINSTLTLTATPRDADSVFAGWSSGCASTAGNTCNVTVDSNKSISATFDINCTNQGGGAACSAATDLGTISAGASVNVSGNTLQFGDSDWYVARFGEVCGAGTPRVRISGDATGSFRLELFTSCAGPAQSTCWTGGGSGTTDTQYSCPTCTPVPWPSTIFFRVYRVGEGKPSCAQYTVTVSR